MISKFDYFPSEIYREENNEYLEGLTPYIDELEKNSGSCELVYQTHDGLDFFNVKKLHDYLQSRSSEILISQGYDTLKYQHKCFLWGQKIYPGGCHLTHVHSNSQLCALYFLKTPEKGSYPVFEDPRPGKKMGEIFFEVKESVNSATPEIHFNNVVPGTILYFNSWLPHKITVNNGDTPTYFMHFVFKAIER